MPEQPTGNPQTQAQPSSPTPPSTTPGNAPSPEPFRFTKGPEYLRGKTEEEVAALIEGFVQDAARGTQTQAQPQAQPTLPADDEYATGATIRNLGQQFTGTLQQMAEQNAQTAYGIARREHAEIFKKYEPEVLQILRAVPKANWSLDIIDRAVKMVRGEHVEEIAEEKARRLAATMEPTIRSTGSGGSVPVSETKNKLDGDTVPARWRERAKAAGIGERELRDFCYEQGITEDEFFAQFKNYVTDAVTEVSVRQSE